MYSEKIERLIKGALADGKLAESEKRVLTNAAKAEGVDPDELIMEVEARLLEKTPVAVQQPKQQDVQSKDRFNINASTSNKAVARFLSALDEISKKYDQKKKDCRDSFKPTIEQYDAEIRQARVNMPRGESQAAENVRSRIASLESKKSSEEHKRDTQISSLTREMYVEMNSAIGIFEIPDNESELAGLTIFMYKRYKQSTNTINNGNCAHHYMSKFLECKRKMAKLYGDRPSFREVDKQTRLSLWQAMTPLQNSLVTLEIIAMIGLIIYVIVALNH